MGDALSEAIADSNQGVEALLDSNRTLSIAFLARLIQDLRLDMAKRFEQERQQMLRQVALLEEKLAKTGRRIDKAGGVIMEMQMQIDSMQTQEEA